MDHILNMNLSSQFQPVTFAVNANSQTKDIMKYEAFRLQSFENWIHYDHARPICLAKVGFFYNEDYDIVTCFSCGIQRTCRENCRFHPEMEHKRLNPNCLHIQGKDTANVPIAVPSPDEYLQILNNLREIYGSASTSIPNPSINMNIGGDFPSRVANSSARINPVNGLNEDKFLSEAERLKTFAGNWPHTTPTPTQLANSGFIYTGPHDRVQCYFCDGILKKWNAMDIPIEEHRKYFPNCRFINNKNVGNIPIMRDNVETVLQNLHLIRPEPGRSDLLTQTHDVHGTDTGIHTAKPCHPHYATEASRLASFTNWPKHIAQTPQQLAKAGFFYAGYDDNVKCFFCDGGLRNWESEDDPWVEHAKWFSSCPYVLQVKGTAFVQEVIESGSTSTAPTSLSMHGSSRTEEREVLARMDLPVVQKVLDMGIPKEMVMRVIRERLNETRTDFSNVAELLDAIYSNNGLTNDENTTLPIKDQDVESTNNQLEVVYSGDPIFGEDPNADHDSLLLENQRLKDQRTCKICMDQEANLVLLPCGHLVTCATCGIALRKCPICRANIKGTVRTYLS